MCKDILLLLRDTMLIGRKGPEKSLIKPILKKKKSTENFAISHRGVTDISELASATLAKWYLKEKKKEGYISYSLEQVK